MTLICNVVGARPNFMKIAPLVHEMNRRSMPQYLVHTGQHYDANMSKVFFDELGLPRPDIYLDVGSDSHARQTARIMIAFEEVCNQQQPDLVIVVGDVNSTVAAALVAAKLGISVAHVEAGLRSNDRKMPEEINRITTDHLSDLLFTTEDAANHNLAREGIADVKVHFVGNCMVDSLLAHLDNALRQKPWAQIGLAPRSYGLLTLHRPSNVDDDGMLRKLMGAISTVADDCPILFPVHPRTRHRLSQLSLPLSPQLILHEPMSYLSFVGLMARAQFVMTDSGGIQEETTTLQIPCLTLRHNTERPVTVEVGTNRIVGTNPNDILASFESIQRGEWHQGARPPLWDGYTSSRILDVIEGWL